MRILILGDLHGQLPKLRFKEFDAIIAPGDFCSDAHREIVFRAIEHNLKHGTDVRWYELTGKQAAAALVKRSVRDGRRVLQQLNAVGVPVYIVPGTNDWTGHAGSQWIVERRNFYRLMRRGLRNIIDVHERALDIGEYVLAGYGISSGPELPQGDDAKGYTQKQLAKKRKRFAEMKRQFAILLSQRKPVILISHNQPYGTRFDKIINPRSPRHGKHVGSVLVREMVLEKRPLLCIAGHMHEHFGSLRLGRTVCVAGGFGSACNVLLELDGRKIKKLQFTGAAQKW